MRLFPVLFAVVLLGSWGEAPPRNLILDSGVVFLHAYTPSPFTMTATAGTRWEEMKRALTIDTRRERRRPMSFERVERLRALGYADRA